MTMISLCPFLSTCSHETSNPTFPRREFTTPTFPLSNLTVLPLSWRCWISSNHHPFLLGPAQKSSTPCSNRSNSPSSSRAETHPSCRSHRPRTRISCRTPPRNCSASRSLWPSCGRLREPFASGRDQRNLVQPSSSWRSILRRLDGHVGRDQQSQAAHQPRYIVCRHDRASTRTAPRTRTL